MSAWTRSEKSNMHETGYGILLFSTGVVRYLQINGTIQKCKVPRETSEPSRARRRMVRSPIHHLFLYDHIMGPVISFHHPEDRSGDEVMDLQDRNRHRIVECDIQIQGRYASPFQSGPQIINGLFGHFRPLGETV